MAKLNQILAIETGRKTKTYAQITALHKATQKSDLMTGFHKTYQPSDDAGERIPPETRKVKYNHESVIAEIATTLQSLFDITATKDWANCSAKADMIVNGEAFLEQVPITFLLFLGKQLTDLRTFVESISELDPGETWTRDANTGEFRTEPIETTKKAKLQKAIVLYDATEHHPAQTQLITKDEVIGHFSTVKFSGAIPREKKRALLARIDTLIEAAKFAREQANAMEAGQQKIGERVLGFIFQRNGG
jgi:hypothetical protein